MKTNADPNRIPEPTTNITRSFVGRFVRGQGNYGTIAVVGRVGLEGVELLDKPKRQFPRDGLVEVQGIINSGLTPGDWVEFDVLRNPRPRAPEYKTAHVRRLARYAELPDMTMSGYRTLLIKEGWRSGRRAGLWALRIAGDRVLLVELEVGKDGVLHLPRRATSEVSWCVYRGDLVANLPGNGTGEGVFLGDAGQVSGSFDWSSDVDHVAQVILSLCDANDPRVAELVSWLERHHEADKGNLFDAAIDHEAAEAALRSGDLAVRLRADRDIRKAYLDAALQDDRVREAIADWGREGHGLEAKRLHQELACEIAEARVRSIAELAADVQAKRADAIARVEADVTQLAEAHRAEALARIHSAETAWSERLKALEDDFNQQREAFENQTTEQAGILETIRADTETAKRELERVKAAEVEARQRLGATSSEVDRLLAITDKLEIPDRQLIPLVQLPDRGVNHIFKTLQIVPVGAKGALIGQSLLLTDSGKQKMLRLTTLMLAGELPVLTGEQAGDLMVVAEALLCPGRVASIEADPTIISVDDLWSRPGSGAPTAIAAAAAAATQGGATLVIIRGIERSGARFWYPALGDALRRGALPRGLLVACVVADQEHDELEALPPAVNLIDAEGTLTDSAYLAGPMLLAPSVLHPGTFDAGVAPGDLSPANGLLATLQFKPSLDIGMRIARMYAEAMALIGNEVGARSIVAGITQSMAERMGTRTVMEEKDARSNRGL